MFQYSGFDQPVSNWDISTVKYTSYLFEEAKFNQPLDNWNIANVDDCSYMFGLYYTFDCCRSSGFNQPLTNWTLCSSTRNMFS
mmetsp:Transcript_6851/g.7878  ORF Transcript_6851/g.7878 Transcript_6851/m.7878 type:complete len:83 (+) Transcript_6851:329-577(+)